MVCPSRPSIRELWREDKSADVKAQKIAGPVGNAAFLRAVDRSSHFSKDQIMAKTNESTTLDRITKTTRNITGTQAAIAGAGVLGGLAIAAALFGGWRKSPEQAAAESTPETGSEPAESNASSVKYTPAAIGFTPYPVPQDDGDKLHQMGIPTTLPIDDEPRSYTGDRAPDMAVDFIPGEDTGSSGTADTRDR